MSVFGLGDLSFLGAASGPQLWTPAQITTALWLDAADSGTVTQSGGLISQVNDKSGNSRSFTASGARRPTYTSSGLNGLPVFTFGGSQGLTSVNPPSAWGFLHNGASSVWLVARAGNVSNPATRYGLYGTNMGSSSRVGADLSCVDTDPFNDTLRDFVTRGVPGSTAASNTSPNNTITATVPFIVGRIGDLQNATASQRSTLYVNGGSAINNNTSTQAASSLSPDVTLEFGSTGGGSDPLVGYLTEVIVITGISSVDTRQRIEGYLAHKWGLAANLPSNHPFKSVAPTI